MFKRNIIANVEWLKLTLHVHNKSQYDLNLHLWSASSVSIII